MSHCKACDSPISKASDWTIFSKEYEGDVPREEENLCSPCLLSARQAFYASFKPLDEQVLDCRSYFYKEFSHVNDITLELQTSPEYASIQIQEV